MTKLSRSDNRLVRWMMRRRGLVAFVSVLAVAGVVWLVSSMAATNPNLSGDLNSDNVVNLTDLSILLSNYNKTGNAADLNGDNLTSLVDLSMLLANYNKTYSGGPNPTPPTPTPPTPTPPTPNPPTGSNRSIRGQQLFVFTPGDWAGRPQEMYGQQIGKWYGNWIGDIQSEANDIVTQATSAGKLALMVPYNIPGRDCGSYSAGGAGNSGAYRAWIDAFANGVGNRKAIIILEPDALAQVDCLSAGDQAARIADMAYAVSAFKDRTQASVYVDGGNFGWKDAATMADRLKRANVANATGFSVNVSNFKFTADSVSYGEQVVSALQGLGINGARYVIDTSRNAHGPADASDPEAWCNPAGRGLGKKPTTNPDSGANNDAFLWIKTIGESDGTCKGGPAAGTWYPAYAQMLIDNAVY